MSVYTFRVGYGRRRHGMETPIDGPCTPAYLEHDAEIRHVAVEAPNEHDAGLEAFWLAEALMISFGKRKKTTSLAPVVADMITRLDLVDAVL